MKIVNKPIKVLVIFNTGGKIEPVKFLIDDKVFYIDQIINTFIEEYVGNTRIVFVCIKNNYTFEIKYELASNIWYLFER